MKHKHYDLIVKYYADMSQKVWFKRPDEKMWIELNKAASKYPEFLEGLEYHIGDQPPKDSNSIFFVDWNLAPSGFDIWAMDKNGEAFWFKNLKFQTSSDKWFLANDNEGEEAPNFGYSGEWRKSLTVKID